MVLAPPKRLLYFFQAMMKAVQYEHHLEQEADHHRAELLFARSVKEKEISAIAVVSFSRVIAWLFFHDRLTTPETLFEWQARCRCAAARSLSFTRTAPEFKS